MLQSITTEIMRNDNFFFTDNQNPWRKSRFHELGIRWMPRFFFLICTLVGTSFLFWFCDQLVLSNMATVQNVWLCTQKLKFFVIKTPWQQMLTAQLNVALTITTTANIEGSILFLFYDRGAGKTRFNVATPTNATVTCTAYVLPYNLQTKSILHYFKRGSTLNLDGFSVKIIF